MSFSKSVIASAAIVATFAFGSAALAGAEPVTPAVSVPATTVIIVPVIGGVGGAGVGGAGGGGGGGSLPTFFTVTPPPVGAMGTFSFSLGTSGAPSGGIGAGFGGGLGGGLGGGAEGQ
jgi:hypothetical protein